MPHQDLQKLYPIEGEFLMSLYRMMKRGIKIDVGFTETLHKEAEERMNVVTNSLGFRASEKTKLQPFLLEELKLPVLKMGKTGPSFDKYVMEEYDYLLEMRGENDERAQQVLEFRGWQKADSSFYKPYLNLLSTDGRLHPSFKLHGTVTGRLSCSVPNLQQIPRKGKFSWNDRTKQCFIPEEGWELWEFDYKTLEFRIAAIYAGNGELIDRINAGEDIHQATVDMIRDRTSLIYDRQDIKTTNFLKLYGGGPNKLAMQLKVKDHIWDGYHPIAAKSCKCKSCVVNRAWNDTFPEMRAIMYAVTEKAVTQKYVKYWSGRKKHYGTYWNKGEEHKGFNALCQGGGAEIVKHALVKCRNVETETARPILTVHDSLVWEIRPEKVDATIQQVSTIMKDFHFPVNIDVDVKKWGAA